jgi:hypothetical protein
MPHYTRSPTAAGLLLLALLLASCTPVPIYKPPADTAQAAQLRLAFKDRSLLSGVATIARTEGENICGEPLPNYQKMIVISKGNPLISNLNESGTYIPAGRKFTLVAMGLTDGGKTCGRVLSFVPKTGSRYEITATNPMGGTVGADPGCAIQVVEVTDYNETNASPVRPVDFQYEECKPRK